MSPEDCAARIQASFPDARVMVQGADCTFSVEMTSSTFRGVRLLERQRAVLSLFDQELATGGLHALSVTARTPEEASQVAAASLVSLEVGS